MNIDELLAACRVLIAEWQAGNAAGGEYDLDRLDRIIRDLDATLDAFDAGVDEWRRQLASGRPELLEPHGELLEVQTRRRHTGVIWAVRDELPVAAAVAMQRQLQERFPDVVMALAPGTAPIAFEWDEP